MLCARFKVMAFAILQGAGAEDYLKRRNTVYRVQR